MAEKAKYSKARKIISLFGSSTEVRFKIITPAVHSNQETMSEHEKQVLKMLAEGKLTQRNLSSKKIEGFLVCPVCGNHKKLNKAPLEGGGSRVRQMKLNRNYYARIAANQEDISIPENLFKVRTKQEHLLQYLSPETIKEVIVPEITRYIAQNFEIPAKYLAVTSAENRILLEELIEDYLIAEREGEEIIRQPFFNGSFKLSQAKFISIRLNFGNRRAGLQRKILLSVMAVAEVIRGLKSGILLDAVKEALEEMPSDKKEAILDKLCSHKKVEAAEEVKEEIVSLLEEGEKELEEKSKEEKKKKEEEGKGWEEEMIFPEEDFFGDFEKIRQEIVELFPEGFGDYLMASELFPKIKEFIEEARSGFKEVYHLTIADVVVLLKMFEGKSLEEIRQTIEENLSLFGLNDTPVTEESILFFLTFLGYIRIQLIRLKEITKQIYQALDGLKL